MTDTTGFPFCFLQDAYARHRSTASNKLLRPNRRGKGVLRHRGYFQKHARRRNAVTSITVTKQKGRPKAGDLADALAFALRFRGRKRVHNADELRSEIVAKPFVEHLERAGFVVMNRSPVAEGAAIAGGFEG